MARIEAMCLSVNTLHKRIHFQCLSKGNVLTKLPECKPYVCTHTGNIKGAIFGITYENKETKVKEKDVVKVQFVCVM